MTSAHKSTIAVVDDDARVLESMEDLLESAGHSVRLFSSAQSLLDDGILPQIDCLIADIGMPVVNGFELRRLAQDARPTLPVILITARHEAGDQKRAAAKGYQGFFQKPFDASALLAAITQALLATSQGE